MSRSHGRVVCAGTEFTDKPILWGWIEGAVDRGDATTRRATTPVKVVSA